MSIGGRIEQLYNSLSINQKEFSDEVGISNTTINNIVKGVSEPSFKVLCAIAKRYKNLDWYYLLTGEFKELDSDIGSVNDSSAAYSRSREVTVYVEKDCIATGGACVYQKFRDIQQENNELKEQLKKAKS